MICYLVALNDHQGGQTVTHVATISLKFHKTPNNVPWQARWLWAATGTAHVLLQDCNNPRAAHSNSTVPQITHYRHADPCRSIQIIQTRQASAQWLLSCLRICCSKSQRLSAAAGITAANA
jgi:hypothetical protein